MTCSYATKRNWQLLFVTKECDCARNVAKIDTVLRKITSSSRNTAVSSRVDSDLHASTRHCSTGSTRLSTTSHTRKPRTDCGTQSDQHALAVTAPHVSPHAIEPRTGLQLVQCNFAKKNNKRRTSSIQTLSRRRCIFCNTLTCLQWAELVLFPLTVESTGVHSCVTSTNLPELSPNASSHLLWLTCKQMWLEMKQLRYFSVRYSDFNMDSLRKEWRGWWRKITFPCKLSPFAAFRPAMSNPRPECGPV